MWTMVDRLKVILFQSLKVKYKGKKLDQFKTTWFRKQNPVSNMNCHLSTGRCTNVHTLCRALKLLS